MVSMLNPNFQLRLIQHCRPEIAHKAKSLLEKHFTKRESLLKENTSNVEISEEKLKKTVETNNIFEIFNAQPKIDERK